MLVQLASKIVIRPVRWLWEPWLPAGKLVLLDGDPGLGKSTLTCALAARFSRADSPLATLLIGAEDDAETTVVPRLTAAGADLSRVRVWNQAEPPRFPADAGRLRQEIIDADARLAVIDPLTACLEAGASANADHTVRLALMPLVRVAAETGCTILALRHLRKKAGGPAMQRGLGSVGIVAAARVAWLLGRHPHDANSRILTMTKSNLGPLPPAKVFAMIDGRVEWRDDDDALSADDVGQPAKAMTAEEWLLALLKHGSKPAAEIIAEASAAGLSERSLYRARAAMLVVSRRHMKEVFWCLPGREPADRYGGLGPMPTYTPSELVMPGDMRVSPETTTSRKTV